MHKYDLEWYEKDIADELKELKEETNWLNRWSEYSDVAYTYTRTKWTGHKLKRPVNILYGGYFFGVLAESLTELFTKLEIPNKSKKRT